MSTDEASPYRPNILLITCDQYRFPCFGYGDDAGLAQPLKQILGFQGSKADVDPANNTYAAFFPGLLRLRENAIVLRNHTVAATACIPSRAAIYTGQYGTRTGVTQTDGLFKSGDSRNFPWLAPDGIPTLGSWMREAGYTTHYFGKWHVSNPPEHSLQRYGFDNWESSYPEPHGALPNNLGTYRDAGFADAAATFLKRQGLALNYDRAQAVAAQRDPDASGPDPSAKRPWFAVASFTNPHDIAAFPGVIAQALPAPDGNGTQSVFGPLTVPKQGDVTPPPVAGTTQLPLNPLNFPQDCGDNPPTVNEDLTAGKPSCQFDMAYKVGLGLAAKGGMGAAQRLPGNPDRETFVKAAVVASLQNCLPFQLSDDPDTNSRLFVQLYGWLHSVVDTHINSVLRALDDSGQADDTIVIFLADHGEYGAAHGMMVEKWHTAYKEALHVPVVLSYGKNVLRNCTDVVVGDDGTPRQVDAVTSHIDMLPTILGLAGVDEEQRQQIAADLARTRPVPPLPGIDLTPITTATWPENTVFYPDGSVRQGVLFITDDEITEPLPPANDPHNIQSDRQYAVFLATVEAVVQGAVDGKGPVPGLASGPVRQPNHIRCVRTAAYKLSRYFDPSGTEPQEWELYDLQNDRIEAHNLVQLTGDTPVLLSDSGQYSPVTQAEVNDLAALLADLEQREL